MVSYLLFYFVKSHRTYNCLLAFHRYSYFHAPETEIKLFTIIFFFFFAFQVMLNDASRVLFNALEEKVFFKEVTVVVPRVWSSASCQKQIQVARGDLVVRVSHKEFTVMEF